MKDYLNIQTKKHNRLEQLIHQLNQVKKLNETAEKFIREKQLEIFKKRTQQIARKIEKKATHDQVLEIVHFTLDDEHYGIPDNFVKEVLNKKTITPLPTTPAFVEGITNRRGQILSVINLQKFLGIPQTDSKVKAKIIVVGNSDIEVGILVNTVQGTWQVPQEQIQDKLPTFIDDKAEFIRGITNDRILILDIDKILKSEKLIVL